MQDIKRDQLWVLYITDNNIKNFRLNLSKERESATIELFIRKAIPTGNNLVNLVGEDIYGLIIFIVSINIKHMYMEQMILGM